MKAQIKGHHISGKICFSSLKWPQQCHYLKMCINFKWTERHFNVLKILLIDLSSRKTSDMKIQNKHLRKGVLPLLIWEGRNLEGKGLASGLLVLIPGPTLSVKSYTRANNYNLFQVIPVCPILR